MKGACVAAFAAGFGWHLIFDASCYAAFVWFGWKLGHRHKHKGSCESHD